VTPRAARHGVDAGALTWISNAKDRSRFLIGGNAAVGMKPVVKKAAAKKAPTAKKTAAKKVATAKKAAAKTAPGRKVTLAAPETKSGSEAAVTV